MHSMFDPKCYELAEHFVPSGPELSALRDRLAQHIQDEVETWIRAEWHRLIAQGAHLSHLG